MSGIVDPMSAPAGARRSVLRHLDVDKVNAEARAEARSRQTALPPITTYRWWARRTEAVTGALIDAANVDHPGRLVVADPFTGGGVIALSALLRGHRVYAQDINLWAAQNLTTMLSLPLADRVEPAADRLRAQVAELLDSAYATSFEDGTRATVAHTLRVAVVACPNCFESVRLFPSGIVSLTERVDSGGNAGWLACPSGHLQRGPADRRTRCRTCKRFIDPAARYTTGRRFGCRCGHNARIWESGLIRWEPVLVERTVAGRREIGPPSKAELAASADASWPTQPQLPAISRGKETNVLHRFGMTRWDHVMPRRQYAVLNALISGIDTAAAGDKAVASVLYAAVLGSVEMAGYLSRWDPRYLKPYEALANHRYNVTTLAAEPNVWGAPQSGRGTVGRRLVHLAKAGNWYAERLGRTPNIVGPLPAKQRRSAGSRTDDVRVVVGSSTRLLAPDNSIDLVCTDPPYHDDVKYGELSEIFRAWAGLDPSRLDGEAVVCADFVDTANYEATLKQVFREMRRALKPHGHLVVSYANREPSAWAALFGALQAAGFATVGYQVVRAENDADYAKLNRRACNLDLILDLVVVDDRPLKQFTPRAPTRGTDEDAFCRMLGTAALRIGSLEGAWRESLKQAIATEPFAAQKRDPGTSLRDA
jgi:putative DNA methylase